MIIMYCQRLTLTWDVLKLVNTIVLTNNVCGLTLTWDGLKYILSV